jgi:hypothetical protein
VTKFYFLHHEQKLGFPENCQQKFVCEKLLKSTQCQFFSPGPDTKKVERVHVQRLRPFYEQTEKSLENQNSEEIPRKSPKIKEFDEKSDELNEDRAPKKSAAQPGKTNSSQILFKTTKNSSKARKTCQRQGFKASKYRFWRVSIQKSRDNRRDMNVTFAQLNERVFTLETRTGTRHPEFIEHPRF